MKILHNNFIKKSTEIIHHIYSQIIFTYFFRLKRESLDIAKIKIPHFSFNAVQQLKKSFPLAGRRGKKKKDKGERGRERGGQRIKNKTKVRCYTAYAITRLFNVGK